MVQIITTQRKPSISAAFGAGLGSGIARGVETGLNVKLNEMLQAKQDAKKDAAYMDYAMQLANSQAGGDKELAAAYASLNYSALKAGGMEALKSVDISPIQMQDFVRQSREHQASQFQQPEYKAAQRLPKQIPYQDREAQYAPMQQVPIQDQEAQAYPVQAGGQASAIHSKNINPMLLPQSQYQQTQPGPSNVPNIQSQQAFPRPQPQVQPSVNEDRFMPNHPGVVRDLSLAQTPKEALDYVNNALPASKRGQAYNQWMAGERLKAEQDKAQAALSKAASAKTEKEIARHEKFSDPYMKQIDDQRKRVMNQSSSLDLAERSIQSGDSGNLVQFFAEKFGFDPLVSTNAALLKNLSADFLMSCAVGSFPY